MWHATICVSRFFETQTVMAKPRKKRKRTSVKKNKVVIKERAQIKKKGTRQPTTDASSMIRETPMPRNNGAVFKVKIKKKR